MPPPRFLPDSLPLDLPPPVDGSSTRRVLVIVNPNSGAKKGPLSLSVLRRTLIPPSTTQKSSKKGSTSTPNEAGETPPPYELRVVETTHKAHATEIARDANLDDVDIVAPIGGDGTLHETVNGLLQRKDGAADRVVLAVIPAGSGNCFAFDLNIDSPERGARAIRGGKYRLVDVLKCTDPKNPDRPPIYSANLVGWSLPSKIMKTAESFRRFGLRAQYNLAINLFIARNQSYRAKITYVDAEGKEVVREEKWAYVGLHLNARAGKRTPAAPDAILDDGLLDLVMVSATSRWYNLKTFTLVNAAKHVTRRGVTIVKAKSVLLEPSDDRLSGENSVNVDGEMTGFSPILTTCIPKKLRVCVLE